MCINIDDMRKTFFKISLSAGYHNAKYSMMQLMLMILACIRGRESFEEGAKAPSAQTLRDRLRLDSGWLAHFHDCMWSLAEHLVQLLRRVQWRICIDEMYMPFFGKRDKLNAELEVEGQGKLVHGYRAKTPGATGSFCFLVISLSCCKIRLPIAVKMMPEGQPYEPWLEPLLQRLLALVPRGLVLADRGFAYTQFFLMLERLNARYAVRLQLKAGQMKKKVARNQRHFQYWMTDSKTHERALLTVRVAYDCQNTRYIIATSEDRALLCTILNWYGQRWDIENLFKDSNRVLLPTSSRNPRMRLYTVVLSYFLFALWQVGRLKRGLPQNISLRSFAKRIIAALADLLGCIITAVGHLIPRHA